MNKGFEKFFWFIIDNITPGLNDTVTSALSIFLLNTDLAVVPLSLAIQGYWRYRNFIDSNNSFPPLLKPHFQSINGKTVIKSCGNTHCKICIYPRPLENPGVRPALALGWNL